MFLGARLLFPDRHTWAMWSQDDNEVFKKEIPSKVDHRQARSSRRYNRTRVTTVDYLNINEDSDNESIIRSVAGDDILLVDKVITEKESNKVSFLHPTFGFLSRAHLTCGVAPGINPSQTGRDLIEMIQKESNILHKNIAIPESNDERTVMKFFGDGHCIVYLKEPILIETIFSGHFH